MSNLFTTPLHQETKAVNARRQRPRDITRAPRLRPRPAGRQLVYLSDTDEEDSPPPMKRAHLERESNASAPEAKSDASAPEVESDASVPEVKSDASAPEVASGASVLEDSSTYKC